MTEYRPYARITKVDEPVKYWYQALTSYGKVVSGVRLHGTGRKFVVGEVVTVFEAGGAHGFSDYGQYKSLLNVPDTLAPSFAQKAPASVALAYIAKLAGNNRRQYCPATIIDIEGPGYMKVTSALSSSPLVLRCILGTGSFYKGATVLIQVQPQPKIIGWWNCLPKEDEEEKPEWWDEGWWNDPETGLGMSGYAPIFLTTGRIPFSANVDLRIMALIDGSYETVKVAQFNHRDPLSNSAFIYTYPTTEADDWLYSQITMGRIFGMVLERYWIKWHKKTFNIVELTELTFPPHPGVSRSITSDGKYFWNDTANIYISDTIDGAGTPIFSFGYSADQMFPVQEFQYGYLLGEPEA